MDNDRIIGKVDFSVGGLPTPGEVEPFHFEYTPVASLSARIC
jgi:hypothetical protein